VDDWDGDLAVLRQLAVLGQRLVDLVVLQGPSGGAPRRRLAPGGETPASPAGVAVRGADRCWWACRVRPVVPCSALGAVADAGGALLSLVAQLARRVGGVVLHGAGRVLGGLLGRLGGLLGVLLRLGRDLLAGGGEVLAQGLQPFGRGPGGL